MNKEHLLSVADKLQKDCHNTVNLILDEKKVSYQDAVNVWTFKKLAEFEIRLKQLETKNKHHD